MSKTHRTIRGININMTEIRNAHATQKAIGNANINARGDYLDNEGNIVKYRHDIIAEYNKNNDKDTIRHISLKDQIKDKLASIPVVDVNEAAAILDDKKEDKKEKATTRKLIDKED
ncbi:MAG: hypothetical protein [Caudoviricetes sp.]|nr:MAG: hypothetical protein [Caudoviricetes sp.]